MYYKFYLNYKNNHWCTKIYFTSISNHKTLNFVNLEYLSCIVNDNYQLFLFFVTNILNIKHSLFQKHDFFIMSSLYKNDFSHFLFKRIITKIGEDQLWVWTVCTYVLAHQCPSVTQHFRSRLPSGEESPFSFLNLNYYLCFYYCKSFDL